MKKAVIIVAIVAVLATGLYLAMRFVPGDWKGCDDKVEAVAERSGRQAWKPFLNTQDAGDLFLFVFLAAGAVGGFIAGYAFRGLFPPRKRDGRNVES